MGDGNTRVKLGEATTSVFQGLQRCRLLFGSQVLFQNLQRARDPLKPLVINVYRLLDIGNHGKHLVTKVFEEMILLNLTCFSMGFGGGFR